MRLRTASLAIGILILGEALWADDVSPPPNDLHAVAYVDPVKSLTESFGHVLDEPLIDVPLRDVVPVVAELSGIPCRIAADQLDDVDLSPDTIVSLPAGVPLYMALDRMCWETLERESQWDNLEWAIDLDRGEILFTSTDHSEDATIDFSYDVSDLSVGSYAGDQVPNWEFEDYWVEVAIEVHSGLEWVNIDGNGGEIERTDNYLGINHHFRAQREIDALLSALRMRAMVVRVDQPPPTAAIDEAFEQIVDVEFDDVALDEAVANLAEQTGIELQIDPRLRLAHPHMATARITSSVTDQPLRVVLAEVLDSAADSRIILGYYIRAGVVWITHQDVGNGYYAIHDETMIYNVQDLLSNTDVRTLMSRIREQTNGRWVDRDGVCGEISPTPYGYLIITQTRRVHFEIADLLAAMRANSAACGQ